MAATMAASTIPLSCNICPKKPTFSDVSHLLTHIASKGHLSHYYKIKVRAGTDRDARRVIDSYDQWYTEWDVEQLMSERMSLKDKKRVRPKSTATSRASSSTTNTSTATSRPRTTASRQTSTARSTPSYRPPPQASAFDPRLVNQNVKREAQGTPSLHSLDFSALHAPRQIGTRFNYNTRGPLTRNSFYTGRQNSPPGDSPDQETNTFSYGEPTRQNAYVDPITVSSTSPIKSHDSPQYSDEDELPLALIPDNSKLKGVQWPGMSIFDSATPLARRRRNQKKDASILEQLEHNSLDVEPTEFVWTPGGRLKKQKEISGLPSSSSPVKSPVRPAVRTPLADIDTHLPWNLQLGGPKYSVYADERLEESLTYGSHHGAERRRKRPFQIWEDAENEPQVPSTFGHPTQLTYLTRGFETQPERDEENRSRDDRRRTRSYFRNSDVEVKPYGTLSERRVAKVEEQNDYMSTHHNVVAHHTNGISSLLAAAENTDRSASTDPWSLHHHHSNHYQPSFANSYEGSGMFSTGNHLTMRQSTLPSHRHGHSLSIDALLIGGCPTTSGMAVENGIASTIAANHNFAYGSGNPYGLGLVIASPVRPPAIHPGWDSFWHGVHSTGTSNGFWGYATEDHQDNHGEEDAMIKFEDNGDAASVGDRPGEPKFRMVKPLVKHDNDQQIDEKVLEVKPFGPGVTVARVETDVAPNAEMDEDMTVSIATSPHDSKCGVRD